MQRIVPATFPGTGEPAAGRQSEGGEQKEREEPGGGSRRMVRQGKRYGNAGTGLASVRTAADGSYGGPGGAIDPRNGGRSPE